MGWQHCLQHARVVAHFPPMFRTWRWPAGENRAQSHGGAQPPKTSYLGLATTMKGRPALLHVLASPVELDALATDVSAHNL
jgi:hypothetical protein